MRRLIAMCLVALAAGCGGDSLLGPVSTCDGQWNGAQNGYNLNLNMTQADSTVTGYVRIVGAFGFADGTVTGTCASQSVKLNLDIPGFQTVSYGGTLSSSAAKIIGRLNGSGFENLEVDVSKKS